MGPETLLKKLPVADRAKTWDAIASAQTPDELKAIIDALPFTNYDKAKLWEARTGEGAPPQTGGSGFGVMDVIRTGAAAIPGIAGYAVRAGLNVNPDTAVDALPAVGGTVGGIVGAAGGLGVGSVPGGIAGAVIGGAAGETVRQGINQLRGKPTPTTPAGQLKDIATEGAIQGGAQAAGAGVGQALGWLAPKFMQSALKPGTPLLKEYGQTAKELAETMLKEGVNVTYGGLAKLQQLLSATNDEIRAAIANSPNIISKNVVAARVLPTASKQAQSVNATKALKDVGESVAEFLDHPIYAGQSLTMPEAQAMKVGTYREIGDAYGEMSTATKETQKALARGLKEEIAANAPEVTALNLRDSRLMSALDATGRRVAVAGNRDPVGFAWVTHHPQTFLMALIDRSPLVKSLVARGMYETAGKAAGVSPVLIRAAVVSLASGTTQDDTAQQPSISTPPVQDGIWEMGADGVLRRVKE